MPVLNRRDAEFAEFIVFSLRTPRLRGEFWYWCNLGYIHHTQWLSVTTSQPLGIASQASSPERIEIELYQSQSNSLFEKPHEIQGSSKRAM